MGTKINGIRPIILKEGHYSDKDLNDLQKRYPIWCKKEIYDNQLKELFEITYPQLKSSQQFEQKLQEYVKKRIRKDKNLSGNWVYFPWNQTLIHVVKEKDYFLLRTNRNKNLITAEEQENLAKFTVGIVGLSIGNGIALNLACSGISNTLKLAEKDSLETTNLNRVRTAVTHVGLPKIEITAEQIYEINPYAELVMFSSGLNKLTLEHFISHPPKPQLILEAIDDFEMKIRLRILARESRIPVIMLTSLGDQLLIDIERYDLNKELPLFNGRIGSVPEEILSKLITPEDAKKYAVLIVGRENVPPRAIESLKDLNHTLVGRPQLMSTVTIASGVAAYLVRQIALHKKVLSGRTLVKLTDFFIKGTAKTCQGSNRFKSLPIDIKYI